MKRLSIAGAVLLSLLAIGYCSLTGENSAPTSKSEPLARPPAPEATQNQVQPVPTQPATAAAPETTAAATEARDTSEQTVKFKLSDANKVMTNEEITELKETIKKENGHSTMDSMPKVEPKGKPQTTANKPEAAAKPSSKSITRSFLARRIVNKEPVQIFDNTVKINKGQTVTINYFTELKGMKGKAVYHEWSKNNRTVFRRRIYITGDRWRAASRKIFNRTSEGRWQARTVDEKKQVLDRKDFTVTVAK